VVYPSLIDPKLLAVQKMSWIVFDDIFFIYDPDQSIFSSHPIALLQPGFQSQESKKINLVVDTPFQLVPELSFEESRAAILLQAVHPFTHFQSSQVRVDTWTGHYTRCVYYIPMYLQKLNARNSFHWMSCIENFTREFFREVHTGICSLRIYDTLYMMIQVDKSLKEAVRVQVSSPDDSTYYLLKWLEKYKSRQGDFVLYTNEKAPAHIRILKKYLSSVRLIPGDKENIIPEIIKGICV
jgi:hypothetical protein